MKFLDDSREVKRQMAAAARPDARAAYQPVPRTPKENQSLVIAGWLVLLVGMIVWPLLLVSFILGVVLTAKGEIGHGVGVMVLSLFAPVIVLGVIFA